MRSITKVILSVILLAAGERAAAQGQPALPNVQGQLMLIRNTLVAVSHANITGNYTVLRDLGSPGFRQRNTAADLAATFAAVRQKNLNSTLVVQPELTSQAALIAPSQFQLVGHFPTRPEVVHFALTFEQVGPGWMIHEISLRVAPPVETADPGPPPEPRQVHYSAPNARPPIIRLTLQRPEPLPQ